MWGNYFNTWDTYREITELQVLKQKSITTIPDLSYLKNICTIFSGWTLKNPYIIAHIALDYIALKMVNTVIHTLKQILGIYLPQ